MEFYKKITEYIKGITNGKNKRKVIENTVIVIVIGIIFLIVGSSFFSHGKPTENNSEQAVENTTMEVSAKLQDNDVKPENDRQMERILSEISGAGKVSVYITYNSGKELVPAVDSKKSTNTTNEKDSGGGLRNINQSEVENNVVYSEESGGVKKPVVIKEILPEVKGVVVVATGASNSEVRENLIRAVQVLTGVAPHKIQVFAGSK